MSRVWAIHHFEILGEAATRIPELVRATYDSVPWSKMIGTRNALIHGYDFIDIVRVWQAIEELPQLEEAIREMLEDLEG